MKNRFYQDFDSERLGGDENATETFRTPFQIDRDRILYTNAFRRLQAKTQVFMSGEYDFYRTRLTHSLEVAQIGRAICQYLLHRGEFLEPDFFIDGDLVEAICLTHDLGHPPFGHAGERSLNRLMRRHGGFEGNAQTLRIITETIYSSPTGPRGMNPTRAFADGVLKYKTFHREFEAPLNHFLYDEQEPILDFTWGETGGWNYLAPDKERNKFRSIECQVMDWADDTAYSLNDIVDGVRAGFINTAKVEQWADRNELDPDERRWIAELIEVLKKNVVEAKFGRKIGHFIEAARLRQRPDNPLAEKTSRYRFELVVEETVMKEKALYSRLATDLVFRSIPLQQMEYKGDFILERIFAVLIEHAISPGDKPAFRIFPESLEKKLDAATDDNDRRRLLCDFTAGMTDGFAVRFYNRLFSPDFIFSSELPGY